MDDAGRPSAGTADSPVMAIEVVPAELYATGAVLDAAAERAAQAGAAVGGAAVGGPLAAAVDGFCETVRTAGACLAGELSWLAGAVSAAADAWLHLDGSLLAPRGGAVAE